MTMFFRNALVATGFYFALLAWSPMQQSRPTQIEIIRAPESTSQEIQKTKMEKEEDEIPGQQPSKNLSQSPFRNEVGDLGRDRGRRRERPETASLAAEDRDRRGRRARPKAPAAVGKGSGIRSKTLPEKITSPVFRDLKEGRQLLRHLREVGTNSVARIVSASFERVLGHDPFSRKH